MNNYSGSKCPECKKTFFELVEDAPTNSNYKYQYLRCSSCKTLITVLPFHNTNVLLETLAKKLNVNIF